ncbi:MAG: hypothetical protein HY762_06070 [Planctomycetes bacterium]|nr:hypothetical protein [Planctomycetota bacterium]
MDWIYLILLILLSGAGFFIGWRYVGPSKGRWATVIAGLSLGVVIVYVIFRFYPAAEYHLIPLFISPFIENVNLIPFAMLFFGTVARKVKGRYLPIELTIVALLVFAYGIMRVSWVFLSIGIDPAEFYLDRNNVCMQSTGFTCGPASAVTLLKCYGIDSTEIEMARLSHTRYRIGVELAPLGRAVALKARTSGLDTDIVNADWPTLKIITPCIVDVKWQPSYIDHIIVVLKADESGVLVADPLTGRMKYPKQEFLNIWRGSAIVIK